MALSMVGRRALSLAPLACGGAAVRRFAASAAASAAARQYTKSHEWISVGANGVGTVGITHYAQDHLGDIVFIGLPAIGKKANLNRGGKPDSLAAVESVKTAADVYPPVDCEVVEVNKKLVKEPDLVNKSPFADGWIAKVKVLNPAQLKDLLDEAAYTKHCESETAAH